jgi:hypothetical protein
MKFWLIIFLFTADGEFVGKSEIAQASYETCLYNAAQVQIQYVNSGIGLVSFCVSNDHKNGVKPDDGVPLDF